MPASLRNALLFLGATAITLLAVDQVLRRVTPTATPLLEVEDGVRAYEDGDPEIIFLGSSHTRSFAPLRDRIHAESGGKRQVVLVPIEWGTMTSYEWVLKHRLLPLMDERKDGALRRKKLSRALIVSEFYDSCHFSTPIANLPARAWTLPDFLSDVWDHGVNDYNRNYLQNQFWRRFPSSPLVQERGLPRIVDQLKARLHPITAEQIRETRASHMISLQHAMEKHYPTCQDATEIRALDSTIEALLARKLEVSVIMFPKLRGTVSPRLDTTKLFVELMAALSQRLPVRIVDLTFSTPLEEPDYQDDLEHVSLAGNRKLSDWALEHELRFLATPLEPRR